MLAWVRIQLHSLFFSLSTEALSALNKFKQNHPFFYFNLRLMYLETVALVSFRPVVTQRKIYPLLRNFR